MHASSGSTNRAPALLAGVWCLALLLRFVFWHELRELLWAMDILLDGALIIFGAAAAWGLVAAMRRSRSRWQAYGLAAVLGLGGVACGTGVLEDLGTYIRFLRLRSAYTGIMQQVQAGTIAPEGVCDGISYQSAAGPELRVAFVWFGIADNWYGVVYDPTGLVMRANEFLADWSNWDAPELAPVRGLFGGDLLGAQHLDGPWYLCSFT